MIWDPIHTGYADNQWSDQYGMYPRHPGYLSEFDTDMGSGWTITVDNFFIGGSASGAILREGSVVRWQYTYCVGMDLGMYGFGVESYLANKDALSWKVAEIRAAGEEALYGDAYTNALAVLKTVGLQEFDDEWGTGLFVWEWYHPGEDPVILTQEMVDDTLVALVVSLEPIVELVSVVPEAFVTKLNGNVNDLIITITEELSDGTINTFVETFSIKNNAADTYTVGSYNVYVDTKGNTQIRDCYIISAQ